MVTLVEQSQRKCCLRQGHSLNICFLLTFSRAFSIWAPIFLGEFVSVSAQLFVSETASIVPLLRKLSAPFVIANIFQSLWTAAFRPKYKGFAKFTSPMLLSGIAYSLSKAHAAIIAASSSSSLPMSQYLLYGLPLSLHFGWTTAASLVNWNGAIATLFSDNGGGGGGGVSAENVARIGHITVIGAATLGSIVTITRGAPVYGGVLSWALWAVASGMKKRIQSTEKEDPKRVGVLGCHLQYKLARVGAFVTGAASLYATISLFFVPIKTSVSEEI
jgi:hypothetical protein